jgi:hypothetical protein
MGAYQLYKGQSAADKLKRPDYQIPDEIKNKLTEAQSRVVQGLPDASKKLFIDNMQRSMDTGLRNLSSRQAGIQGLGSIVDRGVQGGRQLAGQDAAQRLRSEEQIRRDTGQAQSEMAGFENRQFQDQLQKYTQEAQAAQALTGAGLQNLGRVAQGAIGAIGQQNYLNVLKDYYDKLAKYKGGNNQALLSAVGGLAPAATSTTGTAAPSVDFAKQYGAAMGANTAAPGAAPAAPAAAPAQPALTPDINVDIGGAGLDQSAVAPAASIGGIGAASLLNPSAQASTVAPDANTIAPPVQTEAQKLRSGPLEGEEDMSKFLDTLGVDDLDFQAMSNFGEFKGKSEQEIREMLKNASQEEMNKYLELFLKRR